MIFTSHICQRCHIEFEREGRRPYKYCSTKCTARRPTKLSVRTLKRMAESGLRLDYMCMELKAAHTTIRAALRANGLYGTWAHRRYLKCAVAA